MKSYTDVKSTIISTKYGLEAAIRFIKQNKVLGFDLETDGVNPRQNLVMGIGIANLNEGFYLPLYEYDKDAGEIRELPTLGFLQEFLTALNGCKLVAWNGAFEAGFCQEKLGWNFVANFYSDQMLMLHTLNENLFNFGLKENAEKDLGEIAVQAQLKMLESVKENGGSEKEYYKASTQSLGHYCVWDCALTVWYYQRDVKKLEQEKLTDFFFNAEVMPTYKYAVIPMELNGILLDQKLLNEGLEGIKKDIIAIEKEILEEIEPHLGQFKKWFLNKDYPVKLTGPFVQTLADLLEVELPLTPAGKRSLTAKNIQQLPESHLFRAFIEGRERLSQEMVLKVQLAMHGTAPMFNLNSKHHLKKLFFDTLKEAPLSRTPTGQPQADDTFLEIMATKYSWASKLRTFNRLTKLCGTYFQRIYDKQEAGRFYPSYFCHRTTSGRQSGDFQQLPKPLSVKDEPTEIIRHYTNMIRALFISDPGYKFLDADYNSLEVVVFADDSEDPTLINMIKEGRDFYSEVALGAYNLRDKYSSDKKAPNFLQKHEPEIRQATKAFALGFRYGEDPYKLHKETGISKEDAQEIHANYFASFPKLKTKMEFYKNHIRSFGWVKSKAGRKRREPRAVHLYRQYGDELMDSLSLWHRYHEQPKVYEEMKKTRATMKSIYNNALNFPIQSMGASIVSRAAWNLALWLKENAPKARLVAAIHDQLVVHCPDEQLEFVQKNMKRIMEETTILSVPLTADPVIAVNLRDGH